MPSSPGASKKAAHQPIFNLHQETDNDMTLKIIGVGFGRTGTHSTYTALSQLGFPCYHMFEVIGNKTNKGHLDFWRKVANTPAGTQRGQI